MVTGDPPDYLPDDLVCLQWRACEECTTETTDDTIDGYLLLGKSSMMAKDDPEYLNKRYIGKVSAASVVSVSSLQRRAAAFRYSLVTGDRAGGSPESGTPPGKDKEKKAKGGKGSKAKGSTDLTTPDPADDDLSESSVPNLVLDAWRDLLCELHLLIRPDTKNSWVSKGELRTINGDHVEIDFIPENLRFVEKLLDLHVGSNESSPCICAWLRSVLDEEAWVPLPGTGED
uniref:Uncharacterized protein n=1 Tax=Octactis speculum TaxID=3111310 RepID=A0A7S2DI67_9STRA